MNEGRMITKKKAALMGLLWGGFMFVFDMFLNPLIFSEPYDFTPKQIIISVIAWTIAGLGFGFLNRYLTNRKIKAEKKAE